MGGAPPLPRNFAPQGGKKVVKSPVWPPSPEDPGGKGGFSTPTGGRREKKPRVRLAGRVPDEPGVRTFPRSPKEGGVGDTT